MLLRKAQVQNKNYEAMWLRWLRWSPEAAISCALQNISVIKMYKLFLATFVSAAEKFSAFITHWLSQSPLGLLCSFMIRQSPRKGRRFVFSCWNGMWGWIQISSFLSKYNKTQAPPLQMTIATSSLHALKEQCKQVCHLYYPKGSCRYLAKWALLS